MRGLLDLQTDLLHLLDESRVRDFPAAVVLHDDGPVGYEGGYCGRHHDAVVAVVLHPSAVEPLDPFDDATVVGGGDVRSEAAGNASMGIGCPGALSDRG